MLVCVKVCKVFINTRTNILTHTCAVNVLNTYLFIYECACLFEK